MSAISYETFDSAATFDARKYTQIEGPSNRYVWDSADGGKLKPTGFTPGEIVAYRYNGGLMGDIEIDNAVTVHTPAVVHTFEYLFRMLADDTYLMARYNQASSTSSALEIWKRVAGTWTMLATTNAAALQAGFVTGQPSSYWFDVTVGLNGANLVEIRTARIVSGTPEPAQLGASTVYLAHTLAGGDATQFGSGVKGHVGWRHQIGGANDAYNGYAIRNDNPDAYMYAVGNGAINNANSLAVSSKIIDPQHVVYLGDVIGSSGQGDATGFTSGFEPVYGKTKGVIKPVVGDRDWRDTDPTLHTQIGAYDDYWGTQGRPANKNFYAYNYGVWRMIVVNTENLNAEQMAFLEYELGKPGTLKIVFGHRPRYSAGSAAGEGDNVDLQPLWDLMKGHAAAYISAGAHNYQRHTVRDGVVQIVTGAGGESLTAINGSYAGVAASNVAAYGALRLNFAPTGNMIYGTYLSSTGTTLDTFTLTGLSSSQVYSAPKTALNNPWKFVLCSADGSTIYGELTNATERAIADPHMATPSLGCSIRIDHPLALTVLNEECLIKAYKGVQLRFYGPVVTVEEAGSEGSRTVRITAAGVWWRASKRIIQESTTENGFSIAPTGVATGFENILGYGNGYYPAGGGYFDDRYTGIRVF